MKTILLTIAVLISLSTFSQKRYVSIDGIDIWVNTIGLESRKEGHPVIVFESGMGMDMGNWRPILERVSEMAPTFTYDRPGLGKSGPEGDTMTIKGVSERLLKMLNYLEIEPPYVLVGHSLGGAYIRSFAVYYPEMLAGLVIIDPADFTETKKNKRLPILDIGFTQAEIDSMIHRDAIEDSIRNSNDPNYLTRRKTDVLGMMRDSEFEGIRNSELPNIPVHILVGGRYDTPPRFRATEYNDSLFFRAKWKHRIERWTDEILTVDKGMLLYSGDAGHFVHWDDPELVISSIRIVLQDYEILNMKNEE